MNPSEMPSEYAIQLIGETGADGTVFIRSPELPFFSAIGPDEHKALDIAIKLLPEYLKKNVPEFVELKWIPSGSEMMGPGKSRILPAHVIAVLSERGNAARATERVG